MFTKINQVVLKQVRATVEAFGECTLHGDGQFYGKGLEKNSDDNKHFSDPDNIEATYRVKFTKPEQVPTSLEEIEKMLHAGKVEETVESRKPSERAAIQIVKVDEESDEVKQPEQVKKAGRPVKTA
jgi:hypothetical protein